MQQHKEMRANHQHNYRPPEQAESESSAPSDRDWERPIAGPPGSRWRLAVVPQLWTCSASADVLVSGKVNPPFHCWSQDFTQETECCVTNTQPGFMFLTWFGLYCWSEASILLSMLLLVEVKWSHLCPDGGVLGGRPCRSTRNREVQSSSDAAAQQPFEKLVVWFILVVQSFHIKKKWGHLVC